MNERQRLQQKNAARAAFTAAILAGATITEAAAIAGVDMRTARLWRGMPELLAKMPYRITQPERKTE